MTRDEVLSMLTILKAAYPSFYSKMAAKDAESIVYLWSEMFAADDVGIVKLALLSLIENHGGFPPDIAAVKEEIKHIVRAATGEKTEAELWNELADAVENHSAYAFECNEIFPKLHPIIRRWVGSPARLHELGMTKPDVFQTVTRGQFMRAIPIMQKREEYSQALPAAVKEYVTRLMKPIPRGELTDENESRNKVLDQLEEMEEAANARTQIRSTLKGDIQNA